MTLFWIAILAIGMIYLGCWSRHLENRLRLAEYRIFMLDARLRELDYNINNPEPDPSEVDA